ncbi:hypothetical protein T552_02249 [Pneumocystis carinii B80]|uniref:RRM domain-containing protein n=1 Tax=Pneumocystis carinii (strain B80) TaxID=1408658 RepID=A0A0W4ZFW3_PNEC8|nr:hypothetical protein T552_02249 [Pneumocystis carinii B80]KTW27266.1 hypothetical protein T552_02249 [Pneumocystis carinii B80]
MNQKDNIDKEGIEGDEEENFVPTGESANGFPEISLELSNTHYKELLETLPKPYSEKNDNDEPEFTFDFEKKIENLLPMNNEILDKKYTIVETSNKQISGLNIQEHVPSVINNKNDYSFANMNQDSSYKTKIQPLDNDQVNPEKHSPVFHDIDISLLSKTIQETIQQNCQLLSDAPNPIPSSLDLQKLLASLSPVPKTDPQSVTFQTTANNPLSPDILKALNSVSSITDTNSVNSSLIQYPNHKNANSNHDAPCTPQEDALFQKFLVDEKQIMSNTSPHEFPSGSRMFIGNLPTEKVTKKDVFRIFHQYGRLGQIALKQAYGFVQFFSSEECQNAINGEQGTMIRGRKMHLEVSKPQKHKIPPSNDKKNYRARSRSPDIRDRSPARGRSRNHGRGNHGYGILYDRDNKKDRYSSRDEFSKRPSSQSRYHRDRGIDYGKDYRSASPDRFRNYSHQQIDNFPLPRRYGNNVPECQIIITDDTDRSFIYFVEKAFKEKGFRIDTLFLSPRLPLPSVVQQMIIEGIMAIIFLNRQLQSQSKISMQIFDRKADSSDVKFDEYANIDVHVAVALALRKKQSILQLTNAYGMSNYNNTSFQSQNTPSFGIANSDLANLIGSLDPTTLQKVIGALTQSSQQLTPQIQHMPYTSSLQIPYQGSSTNQNYQINQGIVPLITSTISPQGQQPAQQVQDILGQLAKLQGQQR